MKTNQDCSVAHPLVTIIVPAFNECLGISHTIDTIRGQMESIGKPYEMIVVDDGSTDGMWQVLVEIARDFPLLRAYQLSRNFGKELALCAGLEHSRGDAVIVMDADLQHPPSLLGRMIDIWLAGEADIVECVKQNRGNEPLLNKAGSQVFYSLLNKLTGFDFYGASDYKLLDRKVLAAWNVMGERNVFFRGMTQWLGFTKVRLEFDVGIRMEGKSRWSRWKLIKLAMGAIVAFSSLPLRLVSIFGVCFLMGAIFLGGQTLIRKLLGDAVTGFTTVILLQLIIGSIIMVSLGVIGEYIAAIYTEIKRRPRYVIRGSLGSNDD